MGAYTLATQQPSLGKNRSNCRTEGSNAQTADYHTVSIKGKLGKREGRKILVTIISPGFVFQAEVRWSISRFSTKLGQVLNMPVLYFFLDVGDLQNLFKHNNATGQFLPCVYLLLNAERILAEQQTS